MPRPTPRLHWRQGTRLLTADRMGKTGKACAVQAWFFQQGTGCFNQARYGARVLLLDGRSNAISVGKIDKVERSEPVLSALDKATDAVDRNAPLAAAAGRGKQEGCA